MKLLAQMCSTHISWLSGCEYYVSLLSLLRWAFYEHDSGFAKRVLRIFVCLCISLCSSSSHLQQLRRDISLNLIRSCPSFMLLLATLSNHKGADQSSKRTFAAQQGGQLAISEETQKGHKHDSRNPERLCMPWWRLAYHCHKKLHEAK